MLAGGENPRTSPACKDTASCVGHAPELPQGLPTGSPRSIAALASIGWLHVEPTCWCYLCPDGAAHDFTERENYAGPKRDR
jgi:hypothetical protein